MKIFHFICTFVVIFLLFGQSNAFNNFIVGKEYKFKYELYSNFSVNRGLEITNEYQKFQTNLTIKVLSDYWLECNLSEIEGRRKNTASWYYWALSDKLMVKIIEGKVVELNSPNWHLDDNEGLYTSKKVFEMIEQIIMDRSNIITEHITEKHNEIEMPFGGKCEAKLTKKITENKIIFKAETTDPKCVVKDEVQSEYGKPISDSFTSVVLIYDAETNKQTKLCLNNEVKIINSIKDSYESHQKIEIQYLGSSDDENF